MHDAIAAERQGVPAMGIMTSRFASAAELMARVAGMPGYDFATIGHPISSASPEQIAEYADAAIENARTLLVQS